MRRSMVVGFAALGSFVLAESSAVGQPDQNEYMINSAGAAIALKGATLYNYPEGRTVFNGVNRPTYVALFRGGEQFCVVRADMALPLVLQVKMPDGRLLYTQNQYGYFKPDTSGTNAACRQAATALSRLTVAAMQQEQQRQREASWLDDVSPRWWFSGAAIILFAVTTAIWIARRRVRRNLPAIYGSQIDPKKWALNHETGEYWRITYSHPEGNLYDDAGYAQRLGRRLVVYQEMRGLVIATVVCLLLMVACGFWIHLGARGPCGLFYCDMKRDGNDLAAVVGTFVYFGGGFIGIGSLIGWLLSWWKLGKPEFELGPPPVPQPGREQVEQQKVHGDGRLMTREEMDWALRGDSGPVQVQTFED